MHLLRRAFLLPILIAGTLSGQNLPGYGWSSFGVLPFRGYDFLILKAPTRYIVYYTKHSTTSLAEGPDDPVGRAFSPDLKNWIVDAGDICSNSGDFCQARPRAGVITLPGGGFRMFFRDGSGLISMTSADGVTWAREAGVRFTADSASIYERGPFVLAMASFVSLPDNSIRMYYEGGVLPGSPGTPSYYNNNASFNGTILKPSGMILSAVSRDNGITWTREPGVRINPLVHGPANTVRGTDGVVRTEIDATDVTAVAVRENGRTVYRIYAPSWRDGTVSYVSEDGLSFLLEGQVPADRGDAKAIALPDGRTWLVTNQYPEAINDGILYGPQSLFLTSAKAGVKLPPPPAPPNQKSNSFEAVLMGVTGTSNGPVTFEAVTGTPTDCGAGPCPFHPEYYSFSPASGTPPFTTLVSYTGPSNYISDRLVVHAKSFDARAVGSISCMDQEAGRSDTSVFCQPAAAELPMSQMNFSFGPGSAAATRVSNLLSLGGPGYPFTVTSSVPWATVTPANGTAPAAITVKVDPTGLGAGSYTGVVTISAEGTTEKIAIQAVVSTGPAITSVKNAASLTAAIAPNSFISIFGSGFASAPVVWSPVTVLPVTLGGVRVKVGGKDAYISYADPGQVNVLTPLELPGGPVAIEVTTLAGTATANAIITPMTPSWFGYSVGSANWLAALFANTATLVAPAGSVAVPSRSARAGDTLQLYANGLGATVPAVPAGVVPTVPYALDDLSRVKVTIGAKPATVLFAGLVSAGLYQVNVTVPTGIGTGDLPVVMFVDGQPTPGGVTLNFQ